MPAWSRPLSLPRRTIPVLALALLGVAILGSLGRGTTASASPAPYLRGGVAAVGPGAMPVSVAARLQALKFQWFYDYSARLDDESPGTEKVAVLRGGESNPTDLDRVAQQASSHPGHHWIIFNEPDLEGQDRVSDQFLASRGQQRFDYYAQLFHDYVTTLKQADPSARVVAPNLFNWDRSHRAWLDGFRAAYRAKYGVEPPVDIWGLHLYSFDPSWKTLPMLDLEYSQELYRDFREYVHSIPGQQSAPIWATEVGTVWGYHDLSRGPDSLWLGTNYAWPEVTGYLAQLIPWLEQEGVDRWFLFGTNPAPDPWAAVPNALYLIDGRGSLTQAGQLIADRQLSARIQ